MTLTKPRFWDKKIGLLAILLLPFSLIFLFLIFLKKKFARVNVFKIPIICVGNIYIGGTGKTPLVNNLARHFKKRFKLKFFTNYC